MYQSMFDDQKQTLMRTYFRTRLAKLGTVKSYEKNQILRINAAAPSLGIVLCGKVVKSISSRQGKQKLLYTLRPGEIFGEMDLFCGAGLSYSVKVKEKATIAFVAQEALDAAIAADPSVYRYILHSITRKYRIILLQLTNHTFNNAAGMVADALIRLAACSGHPESDQSEGIISTAFTQDELAHNVGCSRITVSRILKKFQQENLISIKNKKILIHDTISLADYTDQFL